MSDNATTRNIFFSGVGGQGAILASNLLGQVLFNAGYNVKKAEIRGMAQRGADVTTHFRYGTTIYSPLIKEGEADWLVSFELLEGLRHINRVKPDGMAILNNHAIIPPDVLLGKMGYPGAIEHEFRKHFKDNVWMVNAYGISKQIGNIQAANVALIGAFSNFFPELDAGRWIAGIKGILPAKLHAINIEAFLQGKAAINV
ncbi:MAG TPA: indolepyruvate oxidoreductase subunit beta [Acidobacteriota bacterium]|nr:indolepyruvate oxidoreductase subunit beta [Acidobacteriota bacterium]